jgi:hypothetical protein
LDDKKRCGIAFNYEPMLASVLRLNAMKKCLRVRLKTANRWICGKVYPEVIGDLANYRVKMPTPNCRYYLEGGLVMTNASNMHLGAIKLWFS